MANSTTDKDESSAPAEAGEHDGGARARRRLADSGRGHMIQKRWIRGALLLVSIVTLFVLGLAMQGRIYKANGGDILDMLGFVGDVGAGGLYILTLAKDWGQVRSHSPPPTTERNS